MKLPPVNSITPEMLRHFPAPIRRAFVNAFAEALPPIFLYLVPLIVVGFLLAWFLKQKPLRSRGAAAQGAEPAPAPEPPATAGAPALAGAPMAAPPALPAAPPPSGAPAADPVADLFSDYMARRAGVPAATLAGEPPAMSYEPAPYDPGGYDTAPYDTRPPEPSAYDPGHTISGWVTLGGGTPAQAALTLVDAGGAQVDAALTGNGRYQLTAPVPGRYLLVCSPIGGLADAGYQPSATYVTVGNGITEYPIALAR